MLSGQFDVEFEAWLQEQLESIKSLTQPTKKTPLSSVSRSDVIMSRDHDINRNKHGGGVDYYQFAYDEDENFDDVSSVDESSENDDAKRRRRLSRILGNDFHDFGDSVSGLDDGQPGDMFDSGITRNSADGMDASGKMTFLKLSTTSLDFSDTVSMTSETGSDFFGAKEAAAAISSLDDVDDLQHERGRDKSVEGFIEFQRAAAGNQSTGQGQRTADVEAKQLDGAEDPLQYELCRPDKKQVTGALISAISGRRRKPRSGPGNSQAASAGIAIKFYKTDVSTDDVIGSEEFLDDDDILVYPQRHQLPVSRDDLEERVTMTSSLQDKKYATDHLLARSVLPADLSLDIMPSEDPYNPVSSGFEDINNDDGAFHSGDLDPIFKVKSAPAGSPVSRVSQQLARTFSGNSKTGNIPWSKKYRCLMIVVGVVVGVLLAGGVAVAMYFAVR